MSLATVKTQIELYFNAKFFADHFVKHGGSSWTATPAEGASIQEDTVQLTIQAGDSSAEISHSFSAIHPTLTPYLVCRVTARSGGTYKVYVKKASDASWIEVKSGTATGRFVVDISEVYAADIIGIKLGIYGSPDDSATFDYAVICESIQIWDYSGDQQPIGDIIGKTEVTKSLVNNEASSASFTVKNFLDDSDAYTDLEDYGYGIIWASRDTATLGTTSQKLFGGRISSIKQDYISYGNTDVTFTLHGHASELFDSPELVYKLYESEYGDTIIEDTLDLMNYLAEYPHSVGWFDGGHSGSQIGDVDDRITSTHSVEYDEIIPFNVTKDVLEMASGPDGTSFDIYETPSGTLVGHLRNSSDWACPVSPTFRAKKKNIDFHRIVNKQKVYGANGKEIPADEAWTESLDDWTVDDGSLTLTDTIKHKGSYALKLYTNGGSVKIRHSLNSLIFGWGKRAAKNLHFWRERWENGTASTTARVMLYAPDSSNYFYAGMKVFSLGDALDLNLPLGEENEYDEIENPNGVWTAVGSPSWVQLSEIAFLITKGAVDEISVSIDNLQFTDLPYSATVEDATSIAEYGTREAEPIIDQTLTSDDACEAKGDAIIEAKKNPPTTIEPFTVDGDVRYKPGDLLQDDADYYRILNVIHTLTESQWDARLTVSEVL